MSRQRSITVAVVAGLIATAIGILLSYEIHWFPAQASTQAHNTDRLYHVLMIASIPIFVIVVGVILYSVWQFRMKPGEELKDGAADTRKHAPGGLLDGDPGDPGARPRAATRS